MSGGGASLGTLPFRVVAALLEAAPRAAPAGRALRLQLLQLGAVRLVLACLAVFTHHRPALTTVLNYYYVAKMTLTCYRNRFQTLFLYFFSKFVRRRLSLIQSCYHKYLILITTHQGWKKSNKARFLKEILINHDFFFIFSFYY